MDEEDFWRGAEAAFLETVKHWELPRSVFMEGWRLGRLAEQAAREALTDEQLDRATEAWFNSNPWAMHKFRERMRVALLAAAAG